MYHFLIVGSGIAGLYTGLLLKDRGKAIIITKGDLEECNTRFAQGGIAAPVGKGDSPYLHFLDTIATGDGLCDERMVQILVSEAVDRIADLVKLGLVFDSHEGEVALAQEGGHRLARILHCGGDSTGERIELTLSRLVRESLPVLEHHLVTELLTEGGRVCGVRVLDLKEKKVKEIESQFTILATGGAGQLFKYTTNPDVATGDGVFLAYNAGAAVTNMEFFQFHPTALVLPNCPPFLISETVRGEGGVLKNHKGIPFMKKYSPQADLAPRDVVSRGIITEMKESNSPYVYLDLTSLPAAKIAIRFPQIYRFCLQQGLDITSQPIPVAPAAHYMIGGIKVNEWGETTLPGLFAVGEVACTGVHGANRLGSNSLLEVLVFAKRIGDRLSQPIKESKQPQEGEVVSLPERGGDLRSAPPLSIDALKELMWEKAGIIRNGEGLMEAAVILSAWEKEARDLAETPSRKAFEIRSLITTGRLLVGAALLREESRGVHFRADFPHPNPSWKRYITFVSNWK